MTDLTLSGSNIHNGFIKTEKGTTSVTSDNVQGKKLSFVINSNEVFVFSEALNPQTAQTNISYKFVLGTSKKES